MAAFADIRRDANSGRPVFVSRRMVATALKRTLERDRGLDLSYKSQNGWFNPDRARVIEGVAEAAHLLRLAHGYGLGSTGLYPSDPHS